MAKNVWETSRRSWHENVIPQREYFVTYVYKYESLGKASSICEMLVDCFQSLQGSRWHTESLDPARNVVVRPGRPRTYEASVLRDMSAVLCQYNNIDVTIGDKHRNAFAYDIAISVERVGWKVPNRKDNIIDDPTICISFDGAVMECIPHFISLHTRIIDLFGHMAVPYQGYCEVEDKSESKGIVEFGRLAGTISPLSRKHGVRLSSAYADWSSRKQKVSNVAWGTYLNRHVLRELLQQNPAFKEMHCHGIEKMSAGYSWSGDWKEDQWGGVFVSVDSEPRYGYLDVCWAPEDRFMKWLAWFRKELMNARLLI